MKHRYRKDKRKPNNTIKTISINEKMMIGTTVNGQRMLISSEMPSDSFEAKEGDKLMIQNEHGIYLGSFLKTKWDMRRAVIGNL